MQNCGAWVLKARPTPWTADGIYKSMQLKYGCGSDVTQMVWINEREMSKYDENYAEINT